MRREMLLPRGQVALANARDAFCQSPAHLLGSPCQGSNPSVSPHGASSHYSCPSMPCSRAQLLMAESLRMPPRLTRVLACFGTNILSVSFPTEGQTGLVSN